MNGLIFWQKLKNPVSGEILGIFPETRILQKKFLAQSVFDPYDSLATCKIS